MKKLLLMAATLATLVVATAAVVLAQTGPASYVGYITSISGESVLVEEDPQDPVLGGAGTDKGYFTVTGETGISRLVGGDALAPATFEDLKVGQLVEATYSGPILESYPPQGGAGSIVILGEPSAEVPLCNIPEGCDFDGDGVPDEGTGAAQYDSAA